ncbi:DNA-packaging protein [Aegicerativicinus sediminis]|uniref:DNA-packaging protein n=1 Tax=Aegicerativicinus sediminis TaxID=2893202 RepID=UPI001E3A6A9A|nr:DNA-packaging protein [Aegicerativicinus sediminis]
MAAPTENDFWTLRKDLSPDGKKLSVDEIYEKAQEYIDYCRENPLYSQDFKGRDASAVYYPKMRAMTIEGLCHHLGIVRKTWDNWKKDPKYLHIITRVEQLIYVYKFEGAAADMLNANIIARELGLVDKKDITTDGEPLTMSPEEREARIKDLIKKRNSLKKRKRNADEG